MFARPWMLLLAAPAFWLALGPAAMAQTSVSARIVGAGVVRQAPRSDSRIVTAVPAGVILDLLVQGGSWFEVALVRNETDSQLPLGWIQGDSVEELPGQGAGAASLPQAVEVRPPGAPPVPIESSAAPEPAEADARPPVQPTAPGGPDASCAITVAGQQQTLVVSTTADVFLRTNQSGSPIMRLTDGMRVTGLATEGEWLLVRFNDQAWGERAAYVRCSNLTTMTPAVITPPESPRETPPGVREPAAGRRTAGRVRATTPER